MKYNMESMTHGFMNTISKVAEKVNVKSSRKVLLVPLALATLIGTSSFGSDIKSNIDIIKQNKEIVVQFGKVKPDSVKFMEDDKKRTVTLTYNNQQDKKPDPLVYLTEAGFTPDLIGLLTKTLELDMKNSGYDFNTSSKQDFNKFISEFTGSIDSLSEFDAKLDSLNTVIEEENMSEGTKDIIKSSMKNIAMFFEDSDNHAKLYKNLNISPNELKLPNKLDDMGFFTGLVPLIKNTFSMVSYSVFKMELQKRELNKNKVSSKNNSKSISQG